MQARVSGRHAVAGRRASTSAPAAMSRSAISASSHCAAQCSGGDAVAAGSRSPTRRQPGGNARPRCAAGGPPRRARGRRRGRRQAAPRRAGRAPRPITDLLLMCIARPPPLGRGARRGGCFLLKPDVLRRHTAYTPDTIGRSPVAVAEPLGRDTHLARGPSGACWRAASPPAACTCRPPLMVPPPPPARTMGRSRGSWALLFPMPAP